MACSVLVLVIRVHGGGGTSGGACGAAMCVAGADGVEHRDELLQLVVVEGVDGLGVARVHQGVDPVEETAAGGGDVADDLPPIGCRALARDERRLLELVEQSRDRRPLLDHPLADGEGRDPRRPCPADDPQGVVLRQAQPRRLDDPRHRSADDRRGPEERDGRLLAARAERLTLLDLGLEPGASGHDSGCQDDCCHDKQIVNGAQGLRSRARRRSSDRARSSDPGKLRRSRRCVSST